MMTESKQQKQTQPLTAPPYHRVCVLGAGVMGAQIAALLADHGVYVHLLDLKSKEDINNPTSRLVHPSQRAQDAVLGLKTMKPSPLASQQSLMRIIPGNFSDDMSCVAECDWIIEAVVENLEIKKSIHAQIAQYKKPDVPVSTNTSGIPLQQIAQNFTSEYLDSFMGIHFFNPPRYMQLIELVQTEGQNLYADDVKRWCVERLGKTVVTVRDTINFIANRIGVFSLCSIIHHAEQFGFNPETVDGLTGKLIGRPGSATFRTIDVVGLDTAAAVAGNVYHHLKQDPYHSYYKLPDWMDDLMNLKYFGQKSNHRGVYEKSKDKQGKTHIRSYNPTTKSYMDQNPRSFLWMAEALKIPDLVQRVKFVISHEDEGAQLVWKALSDVFSYSALLCEDVGCSSPINIDLAMINGFNWQFGVFQFWQGLGVSQVAQRMMTEGLQLPQWLMQQLKEDPDFVFYKPDPFGVKWTLADVVGVKRQQWSPCLNEYVDCEPNTHRVPLLHYTSTGNDPRSVATNDAATLIDLGDEAFVLNFHTKMNAINEDLLAMIHLSVDRADQARLLMIANQGQAFSAGADLKMLLTLIDDENFSQVDEMLKNFQSAMQRLKISRVFTLAAPHGLVLGGGCEVTLHTNARYLYTETYAGLVEAGVGLIPAAGGSKELALRCYSLAQKYQTDPMIFLKPMFEMVAMAKVSSSAYHAMEMGLYDTHNTVVCTNRFRQIEDAKAYGLSAGITACSPVLAQGVKVAGEPGFETFRMMIYNMKEGRMISAHDALVAEKLAYVLCGGDLPRHTIVDEQWFLDLERQVFIELCREQKTRDRVAYMLKNGKPLRN